MEREKKQQLPISLLPKDIAKNTMKVSLAEDPSRQNETARAILYVPPGGCVYKHSHDESNPDSEVYIMIIINSDRTGYTVKGLEVAGNNSPTETDSHSIESSDQPQICIAIKRSQISGLWNDYAEKNPESFLEALGFKLELSNNFLKVTSTVPGHEPEIVTIYDKKNMITYSTTQIQQTATLKSLQGTQFPTSNKGAR